MVHDGLKKENRHKSKNRWIPKCKGASLFFLPLGQSSVGRGCPEAAHSLSSEVFRIWSDFMPDPALDRNLER